MNGHLVVGQMFIERLCNGRGGAQTFFFLFLTHCNIILIAYRIWLVVGINTAITAAKV